MIWGTEFQIQLIQIWSFTRWTLLSRVSQTVRSWPNSPLIPLRGGGRDGGSNMISKIAKRGGGSFTFLELLQEVKGATYSPPWGLEHSKMSISKHLLQPGSVNTSLWTSQVSWLAAQGTLHVLKPAITLNVKAAPSSLSNTTLGNVSLPLSLPS